MIPFTDLGQVDLKSIIDAFSQPTSFAKDQLEDIIRSLALCHLKSLIEIPSSGPEIDLALDNEFGYKYRVLVLKIRPTEFLAQSGLIKGSDTIH